MYSGDLNTGLVWYSNGPEQFVHRMVHYSSNVLNSKKRLVIQMVKSLVENGIWLPNFLPWLLIVKDFFRAFNLLAKF